VLSRVRCDGYDRRLRGQQVLRILLGSPRAAGESRSARSAARQRPRNGPLAQLSARRGLAQLKDLICTFSRAAAWAGAGRRGQVQGGGGCAVPRAAARAGTGRRGQVQGGGGCAFPRAAAWAGAGRWGQVQGGGGCAIPRAAAWAGILPGAGAHHGQAAARFHFGLPSAGLEARGQGAGVWSEQSMSGSRGASPRAPRGGGVAARQGVAEARRPVKTKPFGRGKPRS